MQQMKNLFSALGHNFSSSTRQSLKISTITTHIRNLSTKSTNEGDKWNDAWETAWLPEDLSAKNRPPWEMDVNFSTGSDTIQDMDADTKAFVEEMSDNWEQRRRRSKRGEEEERLKKLKEEGKSLYSLENVKRDYRVRKQRVHAGLWVKEIEKMEEAKLAHSAGDDLDKFLDTASEIFESGNTDLNNSKDRDSWDMKNKPDGWETTAKGEDGNIWEMSQREEDILAQEYERRIAFSKFKVFYCYYSSSVNESGVFSEAVSLSLTIEERLATTYPSQTLLFSGIHWIASFIKQHIFSRRRPIDGWKYMIEELGPNARRGSKGSVSRLPSLADPATQPFTEDRMPISTSNTNTNTNTRGR